MLNKTLSIIASIVIILVLVYLYTKKPKVKLDANGFPLNPKEKDTWTKSEVIYTFIDGKWVPFKPHFTLQ